MLTSQPLWMENRGMPILRRSSKSEEQGERRFILAIDGGGMRGIIPSRILSHISAELRRMGDKRPLYSHFDLIAGTSTGALIAAALSIPTEGTGFEKEAGEELEVSREIRERRLFRTVVHSRPIGSIMRSADPEAFADFYLENGPEIFPQRSMSAILGPIFTDKYSSSRYESFLKRLYGERRMDELMAPTAIISYRTDNGTIFPITSWNTGDFPIWEAARASSAAPLYFPVFVKEDGNGDRMHLIDGGVAANNPSLIAYSLARELYPECSRFCILSLSTGQRVHTTTQDMGGIAGWGREISQLFQNAELMCTEQVLPSIPGVSYTRIWSPAMDRRVRLDDTGQGSMKQLIDAADRMMDDCRDRLDGFIGLLSTAPTSDAVRLRAPGELPPPSEEGAGAGI